MACCFVAGGARAQSEAREQGELFELALPIPSPRAEVTPAKPSEDHVWVPGHWDRKPGKWRWLKGAWRVPPFAGAHWVRGHWRHEGPAWRWLPGYWAVGETPHVVASPIELPPALRETKPAQPRGATDWISGRWEWEGAWRWILGRWATRPHPQATWSAGRWDRFGEAQWRWIPGHWTVPNGSPESEE